MSQKDRGLYSAAPSALGYIYQVRFAPLELLQRLRKGQEFIVVIETLDDVIFEQEGKAPELLQTKHHVNTAADLTDGSVDLWKSLRIWCEGIQTNNVPSGTLCFLVTTAKAADGKAAYYLKPGENRDTDTAMERLNSTASLSTNQTNAPAYQAYRGLTDDQRKELLRLLGRRVMTPSNRSTVRQFGLLIPPRIDGTILMIIHKEDAVVSMRRRFPITPGEEVTLPLSDTIGGQSEQTRIFVVAGVMVLMLLAHFLTPVDHTLVMHGTHVVLRQLFFIPLLLAAVWFSLRGAVLAATALSLFYTPHMLIHWAGVPAENITQIGQLFAVWTVALAAGVLVKREKRAMRAAVRSHEGTLLALVTALDAREHDTQMHSRRVQAYAVYLGGQLGMTPRELAVFGEAALLHDVGKIGVPDQVLLKPGGLTAEEWALIRAHPETGARILQDTPFLDEAAEIVRHHHERFDGAGYPSGLAGDAIPLGARVFAVIDTLDALLSERPYKPALPYEEASRIIREESGGQFDPCVVEAFLRVPEGTWRRLAAELA